MSRSTVLVVVFLLASAAAPPVSAAPTWLSDVPVSAAGEPGSRPSVAVDGRGNLVAIWGGGSPGQPKVASRQVRGSWSAPSRIAAPDSMSPPEIVRDARGNVSAFWTAGDHDPATNTWTYRTESMRRPAGGHWGPVESLTPAASNSATYRVGVDGAGTVTMAWSEYVGATSRVWFARRTPSGSWSKALSLSPAADNAVMGNLSVTPAGALVVAWTVRTAGATADEVNYRIRSSGGAWGPIVERASKEPLQLTAALAPDGALDLMWTQRDQSGAWFQIAAAHRPAGGNLSATELVTSPLTDGGAPGAVLSLDGRRGAVAVWSVGNQLRWTVRRSGSATWAAPVTVPGSGFGVRLAQLPGGGTFLAGLVSSPAGFGIHVGRIPVGGTLSALTPIAVGNFYVDSGLDVAVDDEGNVTVVWEEREQQPGGGDLPRIHARTLDAAGPASRLLKPTAALMPGSAIPVAWTASDRWSAVKNYDVRYRSVGYRKTAQYTALIGWKSGVTTRSASLAGKLGRTYCFSARARDTVDNVGHWTAPRCATTPVDDRALSAAGDWSRRNGPGFLSTTYTRATAKGAKLTLSGVRARRIGLLVAKVPGGGKVVVRVNGVWVGAFNLASATPRKRVIIPVKTFALPKTGTLTVTVVSAGKPVLIDGVYAGR